MEERGHLVPSFTTDLPEICECMYFFSYISHSKVKGFPATMPSLPERSLISSPREVIFSGFSPLLSPLLFSDVLKQYFPNCPSLFHQLLSPLSPSLALSLQQHPKPVNFQLRLGLDHWESWTDELSREMVPKGSFISDTKGSGPQRACWPPQAAQDSKANSSICTW